MISLYPGHFLLALFDDSGGPILRPKPKCRAMKEVKSEELLFVAAGLVCGALTQAGVYLVVSRATGDYASSFLLALVMSVIVVQVFRHHASVSRSK
jgi:hypothetical protein